MWNEIKINNIGLKKEIEYCRKMIKKPSSMIINYLNDNKHSFRYVNGMVEWRAKLSLKNNIINVEKVLNEAKLKGFWQNEVLAVVYQNIDDVERYIIVG